MPSVRAPGEMRPCALPLQALVLVVLVVGRAWPFQPPPDAALTFLLPAGRRECFFQAAPPNGSLELEYQVSSPVAASSAGPAGGRRALLGGTGGEGADSKQE